MPIPLYPCKNLLKDVVKQWAKENNNSPIACITNFEGGTATSKLNSPAEHTAYDMVIARWYFSEIGFDTINEFIHRFNVIWDREVTRLNRNVELFAGSKPFEMLKNFSGNTSNSGSDTHKASGKDGKVYSDTENVKKDIDTTETHNMETVMEKGVTTTSTQATTNTGTKAARAIQNENLSVTGSNDTSVSDSGQDKDTQTFEKSDVTSQTDVTSKTGNETVNYGKVLTISHGHQVGRNYTENLVKLSDEDYQVYLKLSNVFIDFVNCFEKLFIGVF